MKQIVLLALLSVFALQSQAQKLNIQTALNAIKSGDYAKAKTTIDETVLNESTAQNDKAWLIKGIIYHAIAKDASTGQAYPFTAIINGNPYLIDLAKTNSLRAQAPNALADAFSAYENVIKFSKKYDKEELFPVCMDLFFTTYNKAVSAYEAQDYKGSYNHFDMVNRIAKMDNGKLFSNLPAEAKEVEQAIVKMNTEAKMNKSFCAYNLDDDKMALAALEECIADPATQNDNVYGMAADLYLKQNNTTKYMSTLEAGLKQFPNSVRLKNEKINYLIRSGESAKAIKALEDASVADPQNGELQFNQGALYAQLAENEKDKKQQESYISKAEQAYKKAIELDKSNPDYVFNLGALFYNKAKTATDIMNKESDDKKYEAMKKDRDAIMMKAIPVLEQAKTTIESSKDFSSEKLQATYKDVLNALFSAYNLLNLKDKINQISPLMDKLK